MDTFYISQASLITRYINKPINLYIMAIFSFILIIKNNY